MLKDLTLSLSGFSCFLFSQNVLSWVFSLDSDVAFGELLLFKFTVFINSLNIILCYGFVASYIYEGNKQNENNHSRIFLMNR